MKHSFETPFTRLHQMYADVHQPALALCEIRDGMLQILKTFAENHGRVDSIPPVTAQTLLDKWAALREAAAPHVDGLAESKLLAPFEAAFMSLLQAAMKGKIATAVTDFTRTVGPFVLCEPFPAMQGVVEEAHFNLGLCAASIPDATKRADVLEKGEQLKAQTRAAG